MARGITVWWVLLVCGAGWVPSGLAQDDGPEDEGEMAKALRPLQALQKGKSTPLAEVEGYGQDLLKEHASPEEQGRIYFELAHSYAQSGIFAPERAAMALEYSQKALQFPLPPSKRMRMYVYWGDCYHALNDKRPFPGVRRVAAEIYLTGLKELESENLPEKAPEVRPPARCPFKATPEECRQYEEAMKAHEKAMQLEELCMHRDVLMGQLVQTYARKPHAATELSDLSMKVVGNPALTERLMQGLEKDGARRDDVDDSPRPLEQSPSAGPRLLVSIAGLAGLAVVAVLLGILAWKARRGASLPTRPG